MEVEFARGTVWGVPLAYNSSASTTETNYVPVGAHHRQGRGC